jgi:DNA polymerase-3 subunit beta
MLGPEHTRLVSTDGNRFSLVKLSGASAESLAILIPRTAIEPLMALTGAGEANEIAVAVDDTRICLSGGARQLSARRVTGNFPNCEAVLPTGRGRELTVDRQPLLHVIEHIVQFAYSRKSAERSTDACMANVLPEPVNFSPTSIDSSVSVRPTIC